MREMVKERYAWILAALLIAALLLAVPAGRAEQQEGDGLPEWTVMFYLCGSDLESKHGLATGNLEEIQSCYSYDVISKIMNLNRTGKQIQRLPVNVVVQTGGCREWHAQKLNMDIATDRLQRWELHQINQITFNNSNTFNSNTFELVAEVPLASMSKPETLSDFIRWSAENYPAKKYALVLWDHGGGAKTGLFIDELFDGDILYLDELHQALEGGGVQFETVLFDACLMANLETACAIQPYAHWMVGSEEVVTGEGTAMRKWLQQLFYTPQWDGKRLGRWICDSTMKKYANEADEQAQDTLTWSVINLEKIPKVAEYFDRFFEWVGKVYTENPDYMQTVTSFMTNLFEFGLGDENMNDLSELFLQDNIAGVIDEEIYNGMIDALMDAVVYSVRATGRSKALGLSFFDIDGNTADELEIYSRNCPSLHYLAFLDAITPGWHAPEEIYEKVDRLPGIREMEAYQVTVQKNMDPDGMPGVTIVDGYTNLRFVKAELFRLNPDSGNTVSLGSTITLPAFNEQNMVFSIGNFWKWPAIEDVHCCAQLISRYMLEDTYNIPVRLGSDMHLLRCTMDVMNKELTIEGLWEGYNTDSNMFNRSIKSLSEVAGQEYTLLYPIDGTGSNGRTQYEASTPMTIYRALDIRPKDLPAGTYYLDYWVEDMFTHLMYVGRAGLNWDGTKVSLLPGEEWEGTITLAVPET